MIGRDGLLAELRRALAGLRPDSADGLLREIELRMPSGRPADRRPAVTRARLLDEIGPVLREAFPARADELLAAFSLELWRAGVLGQIEALPTSPPEDALDLEPEECPSFVVLPHPRYGGVRVLLQRDSMVFGRSLEADLRFDDAGLARRHAMVTPDALGRVLLEDMSSNNGVWVNGKRVDWTWIYDGDEVRLGELGLRFVAPA